MRSVFNSENLLFKPLGYLGDFIMLSLLWAVCCIPVITIGPSTTALYDAAYHAMRKKDDSLFLRFFRTFRKELKTGILATLIWLVIAGCVYGIYRLLMKGLMEGQTRNIVQVFFIILVPFFVFCVFVWVFPVLSRFTFTAGALCSTSVRLSFGNILRSAAMAVITEGIIFLCVRFAVPLMVLPGAAAYGFTFIIEPVFLKYQN